nr:MAG TPA: hypothetical protein [Caudoviricetes sp.]
MGGNRYPLFLPFYELLKRKIIPYNYYLVYLHRNLNELIWQRLYTSILLWANIMA